MRTHPILPCNNLEFLYFCSQIQFFTQTLELVAQLLPQQHFISFIKATQKMDCVIRSSCLICGVDDDNDERCAETQTIELIMWVDSLKNKINYWWRCDFMLSMEPTTVFRLMTTYNYFFIFFLNIFWHFAAAFFFLFKFIFPLQGCDYLHFALFKFW